MSPRERSRPAAAALALLLATACVSTPELEPPAESRASQAPQTAPPAAAQPVLYARDGTPVAASGPTVVQDPAGAQAGRELAGNQGGRMYILELYQGVIEERDTLALEVAALEAELERLRQSLGAADERVVALERQAAAAAEENQRLRQENVDLAGRLTTAQIRRLQAEKILLELRLAEVERPAREPDTGTQAP